MAVAMAIKRPEITVTLDAAGDDFRIPGDGRPAALREWRCRHMVHHPWLSTSIGFSRG
jgi:hypothetical protein